MVKRDILQQLLENYKKFIQFLPLERYIQLRDSIESFNSIDEFIQFISTVVLDKDQLTRYLKKQYDIDISSLETLSLFRQTIEDKESITTVVDKIVLPISLLNRTTEKTIEEVELKSVESF